MIDISIDCAVDNDATRQPTEVTTGQPTEVTTVQPAQDATGQAVQCASAPSKFNWLHFVKDESKGAVDFVTNILSYCCCTAMIIIYFGFFVVTPVAEIIIGSVYLYDCPRQRFIPIYLIVGGCIILLSNIMRFTDWFNGICCYCSHKNVVVATMNEYMWAVNLFFGMIWLITGAVCIYVTCGSFTTEDPTAGDYCHPTLYWFSFAVITFGFSIVILILLYFLAFLLCEPHGPGLGAVYK